MDTEIEIRPATNADIEQIVAIQDLRNLSPWSAEGYAAELDREDAFVIVATMAGRSIVGFLTGRLPVLPDAESELLNIAVSTSHEREGIGSALLEAYLSECRARAGGAVWLDVRASNDKAIAFYERHGFGRAGRRKSFYSNPVEDAILMSLRIVPRPI